MQRKYLPYPLLFMLLLVFWACSDAPESKPEKIETTEIQQEDQQEGQPETSGSENKEQNFGEFLDRFETDESTEDWARVFTGQLLMNYAIFSEGETLDKELNRIFEPLSKGSAPWIPTDLILDLDEGGSKKIEDPFFSYSFYAYRKMKMDDFWVVSIFGKKEKRAGFEEFFAHPLLLATFDEEGNLQDSRVWTVIENDMHQTWMEIDVREGLFLTGWKESMDIEGLTRIDQAWAVENGKFVDRPAPAVENGETAEGVIAKVLRERFSSDLEIMSEEDRAFSFELVDLNDDGRTEYLVGLVSQWFCGSGGCDLLILDEQFTVLSKVTVADFPVGLSSESHSGFRDLITWSNGAHRILQFDGMTYTTNASLGKEITAEERQKLVQKECLKHAWEDKFSF